MRWEIDADALRRDAERLRADAARALGSPRFAYGGVVNVLPPDLLAQRQREIREDAQRNRSICTHAACRCGEGKAGGCVYWRAMEAREAASYKWIDPDLIADQLWRESRALLAKVGVELPAAPPAPLKPTRWYRRPLVKRFGWFGAVPALAFLIAFYALTGQLLFAGPTVAFLWGAFVSYEMMVRTDARGVTVGARLKWWQLAARIVAITVFSLFVVWIT